MNDVYIISLYHLCRYVFALMLTEHAQARPQFSTKLSAASQTLRRPASQAWYRFDGYLQIRSDIILFVNPNPFHYAEQIGRCALLGITVFRTTATRFHAYLICLTHVPYIMMAVPQTPLSCFVTPIWTMSGLSDFSTIIFTFSIIPYLILFVKHYFCNQHPNCNTTRKRT